MIKAFETCHAYQYHIANFDGDIPAVFTSYNKLMDALNDWGIDTARYQPVEIKSRDKRQRRQLWKLRVLECDFATEHSGRGHRADFGGNDKTLYFETHDLLMRELEKMGFDAERYTSERERTPWNRPKRTLWKLRIEDEFTCLEGRRPAGVIAEMRARKADNKRRLARGESLIWGGNLPGYDGTGTYDPDLSTPRYQNAWDHEFLYDD